VALLLDDAALRQEFLDDVHHEERVTIRTLVDDPRQRGELLVPWHAPRQVLGHGRLTEECQRQLRTVSMQLQGLLHVA
jgi:hypothetical protein